MNATIIPGALSFYDLAISAAGDKPFSAALLFALAVLVAAVARNLLILIAMLIFALLAILASSDADDGQEVAITAMGAISLAILCAWTIAIRKRFSRLRARLRSTLADHAATKDLLDREIAWRQAAEDDRPS